MPVRSAELGNGVLPSASSNQVVAVVPAAETWLIKAVSFHVLVATTCRLSFRRNVAVGTLPVLDVDVAANRTEYRDLWHVLEPGDELLVARPGAASNVYYWISGTKLLGVA